MRQIESAELMVSANNFTSGYAEALVLGTPMEQLDQPQKPKVKEGLTPEEIAKMEQEMETLEADINWNPHWSGYDRRTRWPHRCRRLKRHRTTDG